MFNVNVNANVNVSRGEIYCFTHTLNNDAAP